MTDHQAKALTMDSLIRYFGHRTAISGNLIKLFRAVGDELFIWHAWNLKWRMMVQPACKLIEDRRTEPLTREEARRYERHCANRLLREVGEWMRDNPE